MHIGGLANLFLDFVEFLGIIGFCLEGLLAPLQQQVDKLRLVAPFRLGQFDINLKIRDDLKKGS